MSDNFQNINTAINNSETQIEVVDEVPIAPGEPSNTFRQSTKWGQLGNSLALSTDLEGLNEDIEKEMLNNETIKFDDQFDEYRKRTEYNLPYTIQQVEDVMFIDDTKLVSLEYIYYQTNPNSKYQSIEPKKNQQAPNRIGIENFIEKSKKHNLNTDYKVDPVQYRVLKKDYIEAHQNVDDEKNIPFIETEDGTAKVEALLCLWKIDSDGQLQREKQFSFNYGSKFKYSSKDQMKLILSNDKKYVLLPVVSEEANDQKSIQLLAWTVKKLKPFTFPNKLIQNLGSIKCAPDTKVISVQLVGSCKYVMVKMVHQSKAKQGQNNYLFQIFDATTGDSVLKINNLDCSNEFKSRKAVVAQAKETLVDKAMKGKDFKVMKEDTLSLVELLVEQETSIAKTDGDDEVDDDDYGDEDEGDSDYGSEDEDDADSQDSNKVKSQKDNQSQQDEDENAEWDENTAKNELKLCFFFAADFGHKNNESWVLSTCKVTLQELIEHSKKQEEQSVYIKEQGITQLKVMFGDGGESAPFMNIPQTWFISEEGKPVKWSSRIEVTATIDFRFIGVLNQDKKIYLGYENLKTSEEHFMSEIVKQYIQQNNSGYVSRNQRTKRYLMFTQRSREGCTTYCYFGYDCFKSDTRDRDIKFSKDHSFSCTDCQIINFPEREEKNSEDMTNDELDSIMIEDFKKCRLQGVTITDGDRQLHLKTQTDKENDKAKTIKNRLSILQKHQGSYPLMMYNVGQQKLILQSYIGKGQTMIYQIPEKYRFFDFAEFNNLQDLGFTPKDLRIEGCSTFCILIQDKKTKFIYANVMLIDPYYENFQIVIFKSTSYFEKPQKAKLNDIFVKCIIYKTDTNVVKLIMQFANQLHTSKLKELDQDSDEEGEQSSSTSYDDESDSSDDENDKLALYEPVPLMLTSTGKMYYVQSYEGQCTIKEIDPKDDDDHETVFEVQSNCCYGFTNEKSIFYFIDDHKNVTKLRRQKDSAQLQEVKILHLKKNERAKFKPHPHSEIIIRDYYLINGSMIFNFYEDTPLEEGICDCENLAALPDIENELETTKTVASQAGAIQMWGSDQYILIYKEVQTKQTINSKNYIQRVYQLPCSTSVTLINDQRNQVDLSTFLDDTNILIQLGPRFMIFDCNGKFIGNIGFTDLRAANLEHHQKANLLKKQTLNKIEEANQALEASPDNVDKDKKMKKKKGKKGEQEREGSKIDQAKDEIERIIDLGGKKTEVINRDNRMKLVKMSYDNNYFLFEDRYLREFRLYRLKNVAGTSEQQEEFRSKDIEDQKKIVDYVFQLCYKVNLYENNILDYPHDQINKDDATYLKIMKKIEKNIVRLHVSNDGDVILSKCENELDDDTDTTVVVAWTKYSQDNKIQKYKKSFQIDSQLKEQFFNLIEEGTDMLRSKLAKEKELQARINPAFQNKKQTNLLLEKIKDEKFKRQLCFNSHIFENYLIVQCGNQIYYTTITKQMENGDSIKHMGSLDKTEMQFLELRIFEHTNVKSQQSNIQVVNIVPTCSENIFQIAAKNHSDGILMIVSWDLLKNTEYSMFQTRFKEQAEDYFTNGINQKMNYFVDEFQVIDLEYNIPLQYSENKHMSVEKVPTTYTQQRKIFSDSSRMLSSNPASVLQFPINRLDLSLWRDVQDEGSNAKNIPDMIYLYEFGKVFDGYSLWHHFADNIEMIQAIHDMYNEEMDHENLTDKDKNMPLMILNPDKTGMTALDWALQKQRPRVFSMMVSMLEKFDHICLSKMMLSTFPTMIKQNSDVICKFFDSCFYQNIVQEECLIVYWPQNTDEFTFASTTSFITQKSLTDILQKNDIISDKDIEAQRLLDLKKQDAEHESEIQGTGMLREKKLSFDSEVILSHQRVKLEAIDFDWIFEDDNCKNLLELLVKFGEKKLYKMESFRIFIELMWSYYQPAIIKWIFAPYCIYMTAFIFLASKAAGGYLDFIENNNCVEGDENCDSTKLAEHAGMRSLIIIFTTIVMVFWSRFAWLEVQQVVESPILYLTDVWNVFDLISLILNIIFMVMVNACTLTNSLAFQPVTIRVIGGLATWFLWVKTFYWMRLFKSTAYFITLIRQTIWDIKVFFFIVLLIQLAFANFFFIINNNTPQNEAYKANWEATKDEGDAEFHYVNDYTKKPVLDAVIGIWLLGLGEFDLDDSYGEGPNVVLVWVMFIFATLLILIIFMNMLIAIMSATFEDVQGSIEESGLSEQLEMIQDSVWLLNLNDIFFKEKYIIRVKLDSQMNSGQQSLKDDIEDLYNDLSLNSDKSRDAIIEKIQQMERNNRNLHKGQQGKILNMQQTLTKITDWIDTQAKAKTDVTKDKEDDIIEAKEEVEDDM